MSVHNWIEEGAQATQNGETLALGGPISATDLTLSDDLTLTDDLAVGGDLAVTGAQTFTGATALNGNVTLATAKTLSGTDADSILAGGVKLPQAIEVSFPIIPHASLTEQNLFTATRAYQVTAIRVVPDLVEGGALTGTIVKAVTTATPVKTTTPMHTADAIDFNATAHTVQTIALSVTTADLQLAAGNRIGLDLSAALTTGRATVTITLIPI